jgi:hypothetical protein
MVPAEDSDYFTVENETYCSMPLIWAQLVKEYGRHAQARVHALIRTFDAAAQAPGESIADYVTRLNRLVKTLQTCKVAPNELNHKLKLLNVLPVLPGSDVQHTHFLGTLHTKLSEISVSDLEQALIDHESAIQRQQDANVLATQMHATKQTKLFPTSAGAAPRLRRQLSRPPRTPGPSCCICWNDASSDVRNQHKQHGTRQCPKYSQPIGKSVLKWLDANPAPRNREHGAHPKPPTK